MTVRHDLDAVDILIYPGSVVTLVCVWLVPCTLVSSFFDKKIVVRKTLMTPDVGSG